MKDSHGRTIDYLRISLTDRCNFRCIYCMPEEGVEPLCHDDILRFDELLAIVRVAAQKGIRRVRLTGGEPLVRKHDLIKLCEAHPDCAFLCFTNATLIDEAFCQDMIRVANFVPAISA